MTVLRSLSEPTVAPLSRKEDLVNEDILYHSLITNEVTARMMEAQ